MWVYHDIPEVDPDPVETLMYITDFFSTVACLNGDFAYYA